MRRGLWAEIAGAGRTEEVGWWAGSVYWAGFAGPRGKEGKGSAGWAQGRIGLSWDEGFWDGLGFCFGFPFLFQTTLKLFEFKIKFEFNPNTQPNKLLHQHECNKHFYPRKKFNSL